MNKQIVVFSGCLVKDGKILMVQRDEEECEDAHMKWEFPGGKVNFGETSEQALEREFREETGVEVKAMKLLPFVQTVYWNYNWGKQQTLCFVYICSFVKEISHKKDHHVNKIAWFSPDQILKLPTLPGTTEIIKIVQNM
ncbi:MAG: NUDIX domain-containing protein [Patescibacteria group bacterium]